MEKPLAQLSGLGWQGKHTNLVSRNMGNWFFIGVMYIDKSLPADEPEQDNCGSCTKCLDICPTNAFEGAYKLDARKCIAYLTIEHKGAIDKEFRSLIGNRVFGCDDCLAVCPWNKFAQISRNENYRETFSDLALEKALTFSDSDFRNYFSGTAIKRLGSDRFLRNVIYAMGNSGKKEYIKLLERFGDHSVDFISEAAIWSISELKKNE
jgi:epoxyqueuosine reductase